jgi:hypothetical protein
MQGGEDPDNRHNFPRRFPRDKGWEQTCYPKAGLRRNRIPSRGRVGSSDFVNSIRFYRQESSRTSVPMTVLSPSSERTTRVKVAAGTVRMERWKRILIVVNNSDQSRQLSINTGDSCKGCTHFISADGRDANIQPRMDGTILHLFVNRTGLVCIACDNTKPRLARNKVPVMNG